MDAAAGELEDADDLVGDHADDDGVEPWRPVRPPGVRGENDPLAALGTDDAERPGPGPDLARVAGVSCRENAEPGLAACQLEGAVRKQVFTPEELLEKNSDQEVCSRGGI